MSDINGVVLLILAFAFFIGELLVPVTFGLFALAGFLSLVIGLSILFEVTMFLNPWLVAAAAIVVAAFLIFAIFKVIAVYRTQASSGREELIGKTAVAKTALTPTGMVFFEGELWTATSQTGRVEAGDEVTITRVDGIKLFVAKKG